MSRADVKANASACRNALKPWDIIALSDGKADGGGYGYNLTESNHLGCGLGGMFVMTSNGNDSNVDFSASCPRGRVVDRF